jgi:L-asparaginase II
LVGLARAFRLLVLGLDGAGSPDPACARITEAIRAHPAYVSGTSRDERVLLTAIPGAIGKAGAECCYVVALPDGRAFALKADDGAARVRPVLMAAALGRSGVLEDDGIDVEAVRRTGVFELTGGDQVVGEIRACY